MTYFICSICNMIDFDAQFDLHFKNKLCCEYVFPEEGLPLLSRQTVLFHIGTRPSLGIDHWINYVNTNPFGE